MKHTYYSICPICGANLDPGEKCTCTAKRELYLAFIRKAMHRGNVPVILRSYCQLAANDPSTPLDTLRTLCAKIKDEPGQN